MNKTEIFIKTARSVHGIEYDYNLVLYIDATTKIKIICIKHGVYEQIPNDHLNGDSCPKCIHENKRTRTKTTAQFIKEAILIHGNKYDYSQVHCRGYRVKIKIKCHIHGFFMQTPSDHLNGSRCSQCVSDDKSKRMMKTTEKFVEDAKKIHGNEYDYSLVDYKGALDKIKIICKKHDIFEQTVHDHLNGSGCRQCYREDKTKTTEEFIKDAIAIHGDKYDYSLVNYTHGNINITIICKKHGTFEQRPQGHLCGHDCPKCFNSGFSKQQIEWLTYIEKRDNIKIQHALNGGEFKVGKYKVDGYCKETNTVYEYNGCIFHSCTKCFDHHDINPINKQSNREVYIRTLEKEVYIMNQGYILETIWEHDWKEIRKTI